MMLSDQFKVNDSVAGIQSCAATTSVWFQNIPIIPLNPASVGSRYPRSLALAPTVHPVSLKLPAQGPIEVESCGVCPSELSPP